MLGDHVARHVAPAEAGEQEIEPGGKIREAPDVTAEDPADRFWVSGVRSVSTSCTVRLERFARERLGQGGKRMVGRHHRPHGDARHELADKIARARGRDRIDREPRRAVAQPLLRASREPRCSTDAGRSGKATRSAFRLSMRSGNWQHRVRPQG